MFRLDDCAVDPEYSFTCRGAEDPEGQSNSRDTFKDDDIDHRVRRSSHHARWALTASPARCRSQPRPGAQAWPTLRDSGNVPSCLFASHRYQLHI